MKKGFVYPGGGAAFRGAAQPRKEVERGQLQFERVSSPRKRKRSPESPPGPGPSGLNRFSGSVDKTQGSRPAKQQQQGDYEVDDYLDELGTAALEQYELTQRDTSSAATGSLPPDLFSRDLSQPEADQPATDPPFFERPPKEDDRIPSREGRQESPGSPVSFENQEERIKQLEEREYERDGEVKMLRSELRKRDDQLREMHMRLVSEQKAKDERFARETKSLSTQLEFKDQEISALQERYSNMEQRHKQQQSVVHSSPIPHSRLAQKHAPGEGPTRSGKRQSEFLSTETFMPLSQMSSSDVTPVHVAHAPIKRGSHVHARGGKSVSPEAAGTTQIVASRHSPSLSPSLAMMKGKSAEEPHTVLEPSSAATGKASQPTLSKSQQKTSRSSTPSFRGKTPSSSSTAHSHESPLYLHVPPLEMSSRDLLMLLTNGDLLKVPSFENVDNGSDTTSDSVKHSGASLTAGSASLQPSTSSLPGLLSLLHIPRFSSSSSSSSSSSPLSSLSSAAVFSSGMTTPVSSSKHHFAPSNMTPPSAGTSMSIPSLELSSDSLPRTPIRKSKLQLRNKPHTCARTDMTRSRTRVALDDFPLRKSMSASNTPIRGRIASVDIEAHVSNSLVSSVNIDSLKGSILSLLRADDSSKLSSMLSQIDRSHSSSYFTSSLYTLSHPGAHRGFYNRGESLSDSSSVEIQLLLIVGDIVVRYVTDQMERVRASVLSAASQLSSDLESLDTQSPKSSLGSSTSSRASSELNQPSKADQSLVCQSLSVLETLLIYSQQAREQLTAPPPPEFAFEDETPTTLETQLEKVQRARQREGEEEEGMEGTGGEGVIRDTPKQSRPAKPQTTVWRNAVLEQLGTDKLCKVWLPRTEQPQSESLRTQAAGWRRRSTSVPLSITPYGRGVGSGGGGDRRREIGGEGRGRQLLTSVLRLVTPPWKESGDVILLCLRLLYVVARHCPPEELERFSTLLDQEGLDTYLDREEPDSAICLASLTLLTYLVRSPQLTPLLCSQGVCLLQSCYDYFMRTVSEDSVTNMKIQLQLVRLVSGILVVPGGPAVLFESSCTCCHELLKSVVGLVKQIVQDAHSHQDLSHSSTMLLSALVALLHKISLSDRYFDSHREACKFSFVFALRSLKLLFKDSPTVNSTTKYILSELYLEFCEESEDSGGDTSSGSGCDDEESRMAE